MRRLFYIILIMIVSATITRAGGTWGINSVHLGGNLSGNDFCNMFASGDSIFIYQGEGIKTMDDSSRRTGYFIRYTLDGGKTWQNMFDTVKVKTLFGVAVNQDDWGHLKMYFFPPSTVQFSLGHSPVIFTSVDWGKTWSVKEAPIVKEINDSTVYLFKALDTMRQLYQMGRGNSHMMNDVYVTYDGWKTYDLLKIPPTNYWYYARMLNDSDLCCEYGFNPYYSHDRGKTWKQSRLPMDFEPPHYKDTAYRSTYVTIPDTKTIFAIGRHNIKIGDALYGNVAVWKSSDGGESWKIKFSSKDTSSYGACEASFNRDGLGMVVGSWNMGTGANRLKTPIYMTSDMGEIWYNTPFVDTCKNFGQTFNCAVGGSINNCWAYITPYLYKFDPKGKVKVEDEYLNKALLSSAIKLYPNPVRSGSSIQIELSVLEGERATIKVYTPEGKLIDTYESGSEQYISYTPTVRPGVYFMEINTLKNRIIKNFVIE